MTVLNDLSARNRAFAKHFTHGDMPPLPALGIMTLTCVDARVDPVHVLGLELGEALVFRNNGGRVTQGFVDEVTTLALMVARMTGVAEAAFSIVLMQHTKCGAQNFADPAFSTMVRDRIGLDLSPSAITDPSQDLLVDIARLRDARHLPGGIGVAALLYDVETGAVQEIAPERTLSDLRAAAQEAGIDE